MLTCPYFYQSKGTDLGPVLIFKIKRFSFSLVKLDQKHFTRSQQTSEIHYVTLRTCAKFGEVITFLSTSWSRGGPGPATYRPNRELAKEGVGVFPFPPPA